MMPERESFSFGFIVSWRLVCGKSLSDNCDMEFTDSVSFNGSSFKPLLEFEYVLLLFCMECNLISIRESATTLGILLLYMKFLGKEDCFFHGLPISDSNFDTQKLINKFN